MCSPPAWYRCMTPWVSVPIISSFLFFYIFVFHRNDDDDDYRKKRETFRYRRYPLLCWVFFPIPNWGKEASSRRSECRSGSTVTREPTFLSLSTLRPKHTLRILLFPSFFFGSRGFRWTSFFYPMGSHRLARWRHTFIFFCPPHLYNITFTVITYKKKSLLVCCVCPPSSNDGQKGVGNRDRGAINPFFLIFIFEPLPASLMSLLSYITDKTCVSFMSVREDVRVPSSEIYILYKM